MPKTAKFGSTPARRAEFRANSSEISRFDRRVLELYADGWSLDEIAEEMPGEESAAMLGFRIKKLLASRSGLLNAAEDAALHMFDLQRLKERAWDLLEGEEGARALTGIAAIMQQIGLRIDQAAANSEARMGQIRRAQAREFAAALEMMYDGVERRLRDKYPDVAKPELREIMGEEFQRAVLRIDNLVEDET